jgi:hypothetical protein
MVAFSFSLPSFRQSIRSGQKTTTCRLYTSDKRFGQIERSEIFYLYWKMRTPACELIAHVIPRDVRIIEDLLHWIEEKATPADIAADGFADRHDMGLFFLDRYKIGELRGRWMLPRWYPCGGTGEGP